MNEIDKYRLEIDGLDTLIVDSLTKRIDIASKIQNLKELNQISVEDIDRETFILENLLSKYADNIDNELLNSIYKQIFKFVKYQKNKLNSISSIIKNTPFLISGPCAVENAIQIELMAKSMADMGVKLFRAGAFKPRSSPNSFQGTGEEGLILAYNACKKNNLFLVSEILDSSQLEKYNDFIDVIQIGSRNMASYEFLKKVGKITAQNNKFVLLKRGFSATLRELVYAADYILQQGNPNVILCLRGIRTFEQIDSKLRNTPDLGSILELKSMTDLPVCFDASHSTGNSDFVIDVAKAAIVLKADGLMIETHHQPELALIDGQQSVQPEKLIKLFNFINYELL